MTVATTDDVSKWVGRPLTTLERGRVEMMLRAVEVEIRRLAPDRLTDPQWEEAVIMVECSVAARAARLPDALTQTIPDTESPGPPTAFRLTQGSVTLYRSERKTLGLPNTAAAVGSPNPEIEQPTLPFQDEWWREDGWDDGWSYG